MTGAAGFVGSHLVPFLRADKTEVYSISPRSNPGIDFVLRSEQDEDGFLKALQEVRPCAVVHLAGVMKDADDEQFETVNVDYARTVLSCVERFNKEIRTILLGSVAEYGPLQNESRAFVETDKPAPTTPYGKSKLAQTRLAQKYASRGCSTLILRPTNLVGPRQSSEFLLGKVISFLRGSDDRDLMYSETHLHTGPLDDERDFIDVRVLCSAINAVCKGQVPATGIVNVCSGMPTSLREIVRNAFEVASVSYAVVEHTPMDYVQSKNFANPERFKRLFGYVPIIRWQSFLWEMLNQEQLVD